MAKHRVTLVLEVTDPGNLDDPLPGYAATIYDFLESRAGEIIDGLEIGLIDGHAEPA